MMNANLYTRPDKPLFIPVTRRDERLTKIEISTPDMLEPVIVLPVSSECFITPPDVAERMAAYAGIEAGFRCLEPSAGTGNLIQAMLQRGASEVLAIEREQVLINALSRRFEGDASVRLIRSCFLAWAATINSRFDRIVMNPPYSKRLAYQHVEYAKRCLSSKGVIVACVPSTFDCVGMQELELLPSGTFQGTGVKTKVVEIVA